MRGRYPAAAPYLIKMMSLLYPEKGPGMTRRTKNQEADMPRNRRLKPDIQKVIDPATEVHGKTCTDFISEASNHRAEGPCWIKLCL